MYIDNLVSEFNSEFSFSKEAVKRLLENNEVVDFSDKETLYSVSNRKEQVCQMFRLGLDRDSNRRLQAETKGYGVDVVVEYAIPIRQALNEGRVYEEAKAVSEEALAEIEALKAQLAAEKELGKQAQRDLNRASQLLTIKDSNILDLTNENVLLKTSLRQTLRNNVVTRVAKAVAQKLG